MEYNNKNWWQQRGNIGKYSTTEGIANLLWRASNWRIKAVYHWIIFSPTVPIMEICTHRQAFVFVNMQETYIVLIQIFLGIFFLYKNNSNDM